MRERFARPWGAVGSHLDWLLCTTTGRSCWFCFVLFSSVFAVSTYWKIQLFSNHTATACSELFHRPNHRPLQWRSKWDPGGGAVGLYMYVWGCGHGVEVDSSLPKGRDGRHFGDLSFVQQLLGDQNPDGTDCDVGRRGGWFDGGECRRVMLGRYCVFSLCQRRYLSGDVSRAFALNARGPRFESPVCAWSAMSHIVLPGVKKL